MHNLVKENSKLIIQHFMKLLLKLTLVLFSFLIFDDESFSINDSQIKQICKKERRESICIKILREKKSNLENGNYIEIPVLPYKR